jgi:hypothetical protein
MSENFDQMSKPMMIKFFRKLQRRYNKSVSAIHRAEERTKAVEERVVFLETQLLNADENLSITKRTMHSQLIESNAKEQAYIRDIKTLKDHIVANGNFLKN